MERKPTGGFTLIEILVVVCVVTLLVGLTANATFSARQRANVATATSEAEQIAAAFKAYRNADENGAWPYDTDGAWMPVRKDVVETTLLGGGGRPVLLNVGDDQFEDGELRDPWGNAYEVRTFVPGTGGASGASGSGAGGEEQGAAGEFEVEDTVEVVVSFPNQFARYYDFDEDAPYVQ